MTDVWKNRQIDDLQRMCEALIAEKNRLRKALSDLAAACETRPMSEVEECYATVIREYLKVDLSTTPSVSRPNGET